MSVLYWIVILSASTLSIYLIAREISNSQSEKMQKDFKNLMERTRIEKEKKHEKRLNDYAGKIKTPTPRPEPAKPLMDYETILRAELNQAPTTPPKEKAKPKEWTLEVLLSLEWKRFEEICRDYLIIIGHHARLTNNGADGGIDIEIWNNNNTLCIVQCKAWIWKVSVKEIRELYGIMASEKAQEGIFITTSAFTQDAIEFSRDKNITLLDGKTLLNKIKSLDAQQQRYLLNSATAGDYTTPTCPNCNLKMIKRTGNNGGKDFWGCLNFPRCRNTLQIRTT